MGCKITPKIHRNVATVVDSRSVLEATGIMVARGIGLVVVTNATATDVIGVFSERDLMIRVVGKNKNPAATQLKDVMTKDLIKVEHDTSCKTCLSLMKERGCRHLLVYQDGKFAGVVSLRGIAELMSSQHVVQDILVNMLGGVTFVLMIGTIGVLALLIPKMWGIMGRFF